MKRAIYLTVCLAALTLTSFAQGIEAFDIATFQVPKGWTKEVSEDHLQITTQDKAAGTFCVITVYKSIPGVSDPKENFHLAWKSLVKERVNPTAAPVMMESKNDPGGWQAQGGSAPFENKVAKGVAVLLTVSGFGRVLNTLILTNSDVYDAEIRAFIESADLKKPVADNNPSKPAPVAETRVSSGLTVTSYNWKQSQSRKDAMGSYAGYSANTYHFLPNNSYKFSQVTFQNYAPKYYLEDEEGTYQISGNMITLIPKKASFRTYRSSREEPVLKSGSIALEPVQYAFEIMNLNNYWTLLLSPVDGVETKRDGQFSFWLNGEKRKTYSYNSVNEAGELIR